ncbi:MAG: hypothetical protein JST94_04520 [Bacteroidetes bacterium]|nr:hypothetical protein [Bacteroidota bacterium]MBS1641850.1 hypothetical protein [Bacteroidota bacterium]MBS1670704.1 hypothetical protein [Bacteroidota bacterium]
MSKTVKAFLFTVLIYIAIYIAIIETLYFFKVEKTEWVFITVAIVTAFISPTVKKIKMQSGDKLIISNELLNFFKKKS